MRLFGHQIPINPLAHRSGNSLLRLLLGIKISETRIKQTLPLKELARLSASILQMRCSSLKIRSQLWATGKEVLSATIRVEHRPSISEFHLPAIPLTGARSIVHGKWCLKARLTPATSSKVRTFAILPLELMSMFRVVVNSALKRGSRKLLIPAITLSNLHNQAEKQPRKVLVAAFRNRKMQSLIMPTT